MPQQNLSKVASGAKNAVQTANADFDKLIDPASAHVAPAVHAARLTGLLKSLATAEGAVTECIKARRELLGALEKILVTNREELQKEETDLAQLSHRHGVVESKKQEVELVIIGGLPQAAHEPSLGGRPSGSPDPEPPRPQVEALTPPHIQDHDDFYSNSPAPANGHAQPATTYPTSAPAPAPPAAFPSAPGIEMLSNLASQYQAVPLNGSKKRKIEVSDDFPDLGNDDGIDADVAEMLRKDNGTT